jgi:hypothetical protein
LTWSFTAVGRAITRKQGKAGNRFAPSSCGARGLDPREAIQGPPAAALGIAELLRLLASLGVVAMTVQRDRKTR